MSETTLQEFTERKDYGRILSSIEIPDLIEIQKRSYEEFLQRRSSLNVAKIMGSRRLSRVCFLFRITTILPSWSLRATHSALPSTMSENALNRG